MTRSHKRKYRKTHKVFPGRKLHRGGGTIPKLIIQTAKEPLAPYIKKQLDQYTRGWTYQFFLDADILAFFTANPHPDYPAIKDKFNGMSFGEHKADLFRYYFLFIKGGVYLDADLMIYDTLDRILGTYGFLSVEAIKPPGSIFNGFLAATPQHPIIKGALDHMYSTDIGSDYPAMIIKLGDLVRDYKGSDVKLLKEITNTDRTCQIQDPETGLTPMIHYTNDIVPNLPIHP